MVTYQPRWGLSARGWAAFFLLSFGLAVGAVLGIHPFLAVTARAESDILVVEGWLPEFALNAAAEEYASDGYERVFVTIPWVSQQPAATDQARLTTAARRLIAGGVGEGSIHHIYPVRTTRDRTYLTALALRAWLAENNLQPQAINIVSEGPHARRTRLMYQHAFGPDVQIGIIAAPPDGYDPRRWWKYSEGFKEVLGESIAYIYARFFFSPGG